MSFFKWYFILVLCLTLVISQSSWANERRFFVSTVTIDDPSVADKLIITDFRTESPADIGGNTWTTNPKFLYAKTITRDLQASIVGSYLHIQNPGQAVQNGFDDFIAGLRYNVFEHPQSESMLSLALNIIMGGSGSNVVHAAENSTISPEVLYAQGLANVNDYLKYIKPIAVLVTMSPEFTTTDYTVTSVNVDAALQYNLRIFDELVDQLPSPLIAHLVPTVEFPFNICTQGSCHGQATGTINPGLIAYNNYGQIGIEAVIPGNTNTGSKVGGVIQLHLYLDSLLPNTLGKPLF